MTGSSEAIYLNDNTLVHCNKTRISRDDGQIKAEVLKYLKKDYWTRGERERNGRLWLHMLQMCVSRGVLAVQQIYDFGLAS